MPELSQRLTILPVVWTAGALLVSWPHLSPGVRRGASLLASVAGIVFLMVAMGTVGWRESVVTSAYLVGTPSVVGHERATASLPWYVATAVCLMLGTVGLALPEERVTALARHWLATTIAVNLGITVVRFTLEKAAAPPLLTFAVGITWMAPVVGAFFALRVRAEGGGWRQTIGAIARYAYAVRGGVAAMMVVASLLQLGTHYDVSRFVKVQDPFSGAVEHFAAGSVRQVVELAVIPQLLFWPVYTLVSGLVGALLAVGLIGGWRRVTGRGATSPPAAPAPLAS